MIGSNRLRITGLASGIDVDSIVEKLMKAERIPLNQMKQQEQLLEWRRDDYRGMNSLLLDLKNSVFDLSLQSSFLYKQTISSDEAKVTATADGSAGNASFTLSNATLATAAHNSSTAAIANSTSFDPSQSLYAMDKAGLFTYGMQWNKQSVTGETVNVGADGTTFSLANGAIDSGSLAAGGSITVTAANGSQTSYSIVTDKSNLATGKVYVDHETGKLTFGDTLTKGSSFSVDYTYKYVKFQLTTYDNSGTANTKTFQYNGSKSLNEIITDVNNSDIGVTMFYDASTQKMSVTRAETGNFHGTLNDYEIGFNGSSFLTSTLDLHEANEQGGSDAKFTLNGLQTTRHSNNFTIDGVTFHLKAGIPSGETVSINIQTDTDKIFDEIKSFVDKYNDTIKKINDELSEKRYRDYPPLTDAQKKDMNKNDIKLWNEKAKSGMLANDTILAGGLSQMRVDIYSKVTSVGNTDYNQLAEIGITTSSDYRDHGKLVINEEKLRTAINQNPKAVMALFTNTGSDYSQQGIAGRLESTIEDTISRVEGEAGNTDMTYVQYYLGRNIHNLDDRISAYKDHLNKVQDRYYRQFTAMEKAIQQANQQSGFLANAFS